MLSSVLKSREIALCNCRDFLFRFSNCMFPISDSFILSLLKSDFRPVSKNLKKESYCETFSTQAHRELLRVGIMITTRDSCSCCIIIRQPINISYFNITFQKTYGFPGYSSSHFKYGIPACTTRDTIYQSI